jgi:Mg-chelatase subunit ChlD
VVAAPPFVLACLLAAAQGAAPRRVPQDPVPARASRSQDRVEALRRFEAWIERLRTGRESIDARSDEAVRVLFSDLRIVWDLDPGSGEEIARALLDFLGWCGPVTAIQGEASPVAAARDRAIDAFNGHVDPELLRWISRDVIALRSQPLDRRVAAISILSGRREASTLMPLLACAREDEPRLRGPALEALVGWDEESVHALFLEELAHALSGRPGAMSWLAEAHFSSVVLAPKSPIVPRLTELAEKGLASTDWREVSRALALSKGVDNESILPFLIEALGRWKAREAAGAQALRVEMEILRTLEARSGRKLGPEPRSWSTWWRAVRTGEVKPPQTGVVRESTRASFFGLRPATDRVTFVIDRSGSMQAQLPVATGKTMRSRWEEAVEQLMGFVDAIGEKARFGIVLFHDFPEEWRPRLENATADNKKSARAWLRGNHPGGGTQLQGAVMRALRIAPDGLPDLASLEADTVIVLCDGETAEGSDWVEAFLRRANLQARVVFHCVQVGAEGDGTLQKLASGSGGDFVRVDG